MSRPLKKPGFDAEQIQKDLIAAVTDSYNSPDDEQEYKPLAMVADEFNITPLKVRKLLITGGTYKTSISAEVSKLYASGKTVAEIQALLKLSRASVQSYLPYLKGVYNAAELSTDAERVKAVPCA